MTSLAWMALPLATVLSCAGCSSINTSQSVSPATFLLPGIMKADPPSGTPAPELSEQPAAPQIATTAR